MGALADALNFEKSYTVGDITFKCHRLSVLEIFECFIDGIKEADGISDNEACSKAEELISSERIVIPKAGMAHVIAKSSNSLDVTDATALVVLDQEKASQICRFALGLNENQTGTKSRKRSKKKSLSTGWTSTRSLSSILANLYRR